MDSEETGRVDLSLAYLEKQDLSDLSISDLEERIGAMNAEIERCHKAIEARGSTKNAAESLFKI